MVIHDVLCPTMIKSPQVYFGGSYCVCQVLNYVVVHLVVNRGVETYLQCFAMGTPKLRVKGCLGLNSMVEPLLMWQID